MRALNLSLAHVRHNLDQRLFVTKRRRRVQRGVFPRVHRFGVIRAMLTVGLGRSRSTLIRRRLVYFSAFMYRARVGKVSGDVIGRISVRLRHLERRRRGFLRVVVCGVLFCGVAA